MLENLAAEIANKTVNAKKGLKNDCSVLTGLSPTTKYAFSMQTGVENVNGDMWWSAVSKTSVATMKYNPVKMAKPFGSVLFWADTKRAAETTHFIVYQSVDKKVATVDNILAVNEKAKLTADVGTAKGTIFVAAVVLKDGVVVDDTNLNAIKDEIVYRSSAAKVTVK
jgi:hypothetical protein